MTLTRSTYLAENVVVDILDSIYLGQLRRHAVQQLLFNTALEHDKAVLVVAQDGDLPSVFDFKEDVVVDMLSRDLGNSH